MRQSTDASEEVIARSVRGSGYADNSKVPSRNVDNFARTTNLGESSRWAGGNGSTPANSVATRR